MRETDFIDVKVAEYIGYIYDPMLTFYTVIF